MKKIAFITLSRINDINEKGIYTDLMREFAKNGCEVYIISPIERRFNMPTTIIDYVDCEDWHKNVHILKIRTGNIQKTNIIEKGISTVMLESQLLKGIKKYLKNVKFDLVLYSTPPITLVKPVKYIKKRDGAETYLLLKDIFPQNAVDLGMLKKGGLKGILYKYFRKKEKKLYALSDRIGCMSQANVDYVLKNNPEINSSVVEICPNCIECTNVALNEKEKIGMREKYGIPIDKRIFVYGGNLGKPQDIAFVIECLKANSEYEDRFFVICGTGTEYPKIKNYVDTEKPKNVLLINGLPKDEYESFVGCCDVGLIFLDHRFTIPNFPSRLLSYMQKGMPVLACTDANTDIGKVITEGSFGWWCESDDVQSFLNMVETVCKQDLRETGKKGFEYLKQNYSVSEAYKTILQKDNFNN